MDESRYARLCLLSLNTCLSRLRGVIDHYHVHRGTNTFETFLNNNKERLFHLRFRQCCCGHRNKIPPMTKVQWDSLYVRTNSACAHGHGSGDCPCKFMAKSGIKSDILDITMCCLILCNICSAISKSDIVTIRQTRNSLIHASEAKLDEPTFNRMWSDIEKALVNLSNTVSAQFGIDTQGIVQRLKDRIIDPCELEALKAIMTDDRNYKDLYEVRNSW